jgi:bis(5'-nucleosidyl)-tetraphosphatase
MSNPNELKACGVLVVRGDPISQFLLMRHADRWDLPKGHVDAGESELACALRELEEETGITADVVRIDPHFAFALRYHVQYARTGGERRLKTLKIFLGRLQKDVPIVTTEHQGHQWFDWSPPHAIQVQTIDPLLANLDAYLRRTK